jgi:hypothetical protein
MAKENEGVLTVDILAVRLKAYEDKLIREGLTRQSDIKGRENSVTNDYARGQINAYGNAVLWLKRIVRTDDLYKSLGGG